MPHDDSIDNAPHYTSPDQLRIGLHVFVDLPWFLHPFTLNSFKIASDEQIAELRALKLSRFRYDPERSEAVPVEAAFSAKAPPAEENAEVEIAVAGPGLTEEDKRAAHVREHRRAVAQTEKSFIKAAGIMRRVTRNILQKPKEVMEEASGLVEQMTAVFLERSNVSLHVMGERCGGEEAYFHSLNVSILSMLLAKGLELSAAQARSLAMGALLHDIGQVEIPDRVLKKSPEEYTRAERELHASHVEGGVRIGAQLNLAPEILTIVAQHHEMADGTGYPRGLKLDEIALLARVVSLVNFYENLCNPVAINQAMTPHEALSFIFARRKDKFDARILQLMIRALGVYPPGSIVKLSNDEIAIVTSVNPLKTLRPWVMLYDAAVPRQEAVMVDLDREAGLSIAKCLRPILLPPAVYAYLSPRKRITYFFDSDSPVSEERA